MPLCTGNTKGNTNKEGIQGSPLVCLSAQRPGPRHTIYSALATASGSPHTYVSYTCIRVRAIPHMPYERPLSQLVVGPIRMRVHIHVSEHPMTGRGAVSADVDPELLPAGAALPPVASHGR